LWLSALGELQMRSAIYYPHTKIRSASFLKSALLLWDEVHVIVPWEGYELEPSPRDEAAAFEVVGRKLHPSKKEKKQAHEVVEDFLSRPLPRAFFLRPDGDDHEYEMFTHKLLPETWDLLRESRVARPLLSRTSHYAASHPMGLALMNILADCCAGQTFARVTDRSDAYASLAGLFLEDEGDERVQYSEEILSDFEHSGDREALVPIATGVIDAESLTLDQLVRFRDREAKSSGYALRDLRHRFADRVESQVKALSVSRSSRERTELKREFSEEMRDDHLALRDALKLEAKQVLGMKEIVGTALIPLAHIGSHMLGLPNVATALDITTASVAMGGLYSAKSKFAQTRRKILAEHPTAYLYEAKGGLRL
jgi:hypothetical protein